MNFLKGLLSTLLTFLLFLSLAAFGTLFALRSTLLDPDFVVAQVEKLDIRSVRRKNRSDLIVNVVLAALMEKGGKS